MSPYLYFYPELMDRGGLGWVCVCVCVEGLQREKKRNN